MSNPFQHGPSGFSQDGTFGNFLPRIRSSYLTNPNLGTTPATNAPYNRLAHLLNPSSDSVSDLYSTHPSQPSSAVNNERNMNSPEGPPPGSASQGPQIPSFSRAFDMFMGDGKAANLWTSPQKNNGFFIPSYLQGSTYIQRLEEAYKAQQVQKESQPQAGGSLQTSQAPGPLRNKSSASHLGMKFDVIERTPPAEEDETVAPLPSRWNKEDKIGGLDVLGDGLEVKYTTSRGVRDHEYEMYSIRADHPIPSQAGLYYFELQILPDTHPLTRRRDEATVCIGLSSKHVSLSRPLGWETDSYGYHGDDGDIYNQHNNGKRYGPHFGPEDTVGCGVNFRTKTAFFTRNGIFLKTAFRDIKGKLYPTIGVKKPGEHIRVNFGQRPFIFDINKMMKDEQAIIRDAISHASIERLVSPPQDETELIQGLVLQFLQHDGYVETARAFAAEIHAEKEALNIDPSIPVEGIRRTILEGDIDRALRFTNKYYPQVLKENHQVYFRLKCRKFIEMVRKSAELNHGVGKKNNGHTFDDIPNEMDVDENGYSDQMETEDVPDPSTTNSDYLLAETIQYGQQLQAEFKNDSRREVEKSLNEVFALLAYPNPLEVKEIAHLLDRKGRVAVAEELNSAILCKLPTGLLPRGLSLMVFEASLGKSSRSALENVYGQTSVLLDYLREGGGPGSFITIQSVIDDIPVRSQPF
ncbi:hypothetical protein SLS62_003294 [Diatrype stigma]|uniref:Protein ssh4 n=1 Tax=Diatrype stigma TaxID=117547 RepID=A0AAN9UVI5_9PEZI